MHEDLGLAELGAAGAPVAAIPDQGAIEYSSPDFRCAGYLVLPSSSVMKICEVPSNWPARDRASRRHAVVAMPPAVRPFMLATNSKGVTTKPGLLWSVSPGNSLAVCRQPIVGELGMLGACRSSCRRDPVLEGVRSACGRRC